MVRYHKRRLGELPSDLDLVTDSVGPPPAWFRPEEKQPKYWGLPYYFPFLGDREAEIEVNPIEKLEDIKFRQEMPKNIPAVAYRYTDIKPISPMFRPNRAKYGYGDTEASSKLSIVGIAAIIIGLLVLLNSRK